jgi:glycosyltransferase involved in cell wall biosynthesis
VLITFEKDGDRDDGAEVARRLAERDVRWVPLRYHKWPKWPATMFDVAHGVVRAVVEILRSRARVVHGRTYLGGVIAAVAARLARAKFVYHNEGFYPDEQVDGGVWAAGSAPHRVARRIDDFLYGSAAAVVALSHRAKTDIARRPAVAQSATPVIVVPSCVDLERFGRPPRDARRSSGTLRLVYIGSIGYRYLFARVVEFVAVAARRADVSFRVLTPAIPEAESVLRRSGLPAGSWSVARVAHGQMPDELAVQDAGLFFLTQGLSEHGCSPTKIGEYWASGLPVVTTPNVSDTDAIVRSDRVGVVLSGFSEAAYGEAIDELLGLLRDPDLPARCRRAAEAHYSLDRGCERQRALWLALAGVQADASGAAGARA